MSQQDQASTPISEARGELQRGADKALKEVSEIVQGFCRDNVIPHSDGLEKQIGLAINRHSETVKESFSDAFEPMSLAYQISYGKCLDEFREILASYTVRPWHGSREGWVHLQTAYTKLNDAAEAHLGSRSDKVAAASEASGAVFDFQDADYYMFTGRTILQELIAELTGGGHATAQPQEARVTKEAMTKLLDVAKDALHKVRRAVLEAKNEYAVVYWEVAEDRLRAVCWKLQLCIDEGRPYDGTVLMFFNIKLLLDLLKRKEQNK